MKMNIFFGNLFWGVLLILIGASIILRGFNINFPLVKIFIAVIIILFGLKLLFGSSSFTRSSSGFRSHSGIKTGSDREHSVVFGSGVIDLTDLNQDSPPIEVNAIFGNALVKLPANLAFDFNTTAVFGSCILPDGSSISMGSRDQALGNNQQSKIPVEANAVFGRIEIVFENPSNTHQKKSSAQDADTLNTF